MMTLEERTLLDRLEKENASLRKRLGVARWYLQIAAFRGTLCTPELPGDLCSPVRGHHKDCVREGDGYKRVGEIVLEKILELEALQRSRAGVAR